ncbi:hypothetical protein AAGT10_14800 (plasmid) [Sulfolobus tengchongensis]
MRKETIERMIEIGDRVILVSAGDPIVDYDACIVEENPIRNKGKNCSIPLEDTD